MEIKPEKNKILVTGAGGFIGSHLVEKLVSEGNQVKAFVRYNSRGDTGFLRMLPKHIQSLLEIVAGDLRDQTAVRDAMKGCHIVYHLGALISIPYSYLHPTEVAETNILGTLNVLNACRETDVERLIHTSSSEVYGTAREVPISEGHVLQGQSPYSASKIGADKMAESYFCAYNLPVVTVRPFNTYGPRQSARAVIPAIISQALLSKAIHLGNMEATRDFTYIDDTVRGFLLAGITPNLNGMVFNLGTGEDISIRTLVEKILEKIGKAMDVIIDDERLRPERSEVERLISDNRLAKETLGWKTMISFDQGLDQTIDWIRNHIDLYRPGIYQF